MASRGSIIASAKSIPGGARPTAAPAGPSIGNLSPLAMQLDSGGSGWGATYNSSLPRPTQTFTEGAFGPLSPILPVPVDAPEPGTEMPDPRLFQYPVSWNLPVGAPGAEGIKLADFSTLQTLADLYSVARACIQLRKTEIRGIEWDILPTTEASKAMRSDRSAMKDFGERRAEAVKFFKRPDPDYFSWSSWLDALLEEIFVYDALSVLFRMKWAKGQGRGLLGSDLDSLSLINGPTIRPLLGLHGERPLPPAPAYQQYLYGVPRCDMMSLVTERDIERGNLAGAEYNKYRSDQLLYLPMVPRRWTPYGFPPIERALIPVMAGLQKQGYQLDYFREGTVPAVYVSPGGVNSNMTPNQIRELQDALNAIAGDPAWKHKIIVLPADSKVMPQREHQLADQFDEIVMNQVCMAFDVQPMELGIMPKVSTSVSPGASNQMAKATQGIQERKATKPTLMFLADIMNQVLQDVAGQEDMKFVFEGLEEQEDEATKTTMLVTQIGAGLASIDEAREELNKQPWGIPETSDPGWATMQGWAPLTQAVGATQTGLQIGALLEAKPGAGDGDDPTEGGQAAPPKKPTPSGGSTGNEGQSPGHDAAESTDDNAGAKAPSQKSSRPGSAHQARRDGHVSGVSDEVGKKLTEVLHAYQEGHLAAPTALNTAVSVLASGYKRVMSQARRDALRDHGVSKSLVVKGEDDELDDGGDDAGYDTVDSEAMTLAEGQRSWLMGFLADVANGLANFASRIGLYARNLNTAYNQTYGQTLQKTPDQYQITWVLGHTEHCKLCVNRDGKIYTFDTLPGYPGDGGFGGLCMGGQNCGCSLEYTKVGIPPVTGSNPGREEAIGYYSQQLSDITARRDRADQARADFLSSIPAGPSARAQNRDDIRRDLANQANERIRASGGYGGISVEPADIPAQDVADAVRVGKAADSELKALVRHLKKGRDITTWEPRHIAHPVLARISEHLAKGLDPETAVTVVRRVLDNGQEVQREEDEPEPPAAGGGAPTLKSDAGRAAYGQMLRNYPADAIEWMKSVPWTGPAAVPLTELDFDDAEDWAAHHEVDRVHHFTEEIESGNTPRPIVAVKKPGHEHLRIIDGHHRALAYRSLDKPVPAYVGTVPTGSGPWDETHLSQVHRGDDPANKTGDLWAHKE